MRSAAPCMKVDLMLRRSIAFVLRFAPASWPAFGPARRSPTPPTRCFRRGCASASNRRRAWCVSRRFPGFEDADNKVAIGLLELPPPAYESVEKSMFGKVPARRDRRKARDVSLRRRHRLSPHRQDRGQRRHPAQMVPARRARSAGPNADLAALVTVDVPEAGARASTPTKLVRAALASVTFRAPPLAEQLAMLPFKLDDLAGFRVMQAMPAGGGRSSPTGRATTSHGSLT